MKESLFDFRNPDRFYQLGRTFAFQKEWLKYASCYQNWVEPFKKLILIAESSKFCIHVKGIFYRRLLF